MVFVKDGTPFDVITRGEAWKSEAGYLKCSGTGNHLFAGKGLGTGDAVVRARVALVDVDGSAASVQIDQGHFGFDGATGGMFVSGGVFGRIRTLGHYQDYLTPGVPFDLVVSRTRGVLRIEIDGKSVHEQADTRARFGTVGLRPWRATMRVYAFSAEGLPTMPRVLGTREPFPIPTLDLSSERHRHVVIAQGTETLYNGHPTTLLMPDGTTMFCVYPLGHGKPGAVLRRSEDAGLSWSGPVATPGNWSDSNNCPALFRFVGPDATERLLVFEGNGAMRQAHSLDGGATWSPMAPNGLKTVMPFTAIIELKDGVLMGGWNYSGGTYLSFSEDGGMTWSAQRLVAEATDEFPDAYPCEPAFVRSPNGKQIAMLMRENSRLYNSMVMFTEDEGRTWTPMRELPRTLSGDRHQPRYAPDGRLVIPFRDTAPATPDGNHFVAWVGTYDDVATGRPGQYRVKLLHSYAGTDHGYPGNELLPDGTFVITTYVKYNPGPEKQSVVSVRFRLTETDGMLTTTR